MMVKVGKLFGIIASAITVIIACVGFYVWIDNMVSKAVALRVEPYEHLLNGISLIQDDEPDLAVDELFLALNGLKQHGVEENRLIAAVDQYLYAIVNSDEISKHSPDFELVLPLIGKTTPKYAWHHHQLGWYYMRTDRPHKAKEEFNLAEDKFRQEQDFRGAADPAWGLTLISLSEGDTDTAVNLYQDAAELNPKEFALEGFVNDFSALQKEKWFQQLERMYYPKFEDAKSKFFEQLRAKVDAAN